MTFATASDPQPVQFLTVDGEFAPNESAAEFASELEALDHEQLREMYRDMALTRAFDTECTNLQRQGQLALWVPSVGQEAAQVGSARATAPQDHIFPAYREHAVARIRGVDFLSIVAQFRGVTHGGWDVTDPANGNFHLYTLVIGSQALHATGYAMGQVLDATKRAGSNSLEPGEEARETGDATMVYFGDGATSQGDVNEAMIFAASYQTPQVFFLQNNKWAISVSVKRQSRTPIYRRAAGFGLKSIQIDGNDVLASYAVTKRLLDNARTGGGPGFIEALTYRIGAHTTSDDPTRYRENAELDEWMAKDPIIRFEKYLRNQGVDQAFFDSVTEEGAQLGLYIRDGVLHMPVPTADAMFAHVYSEPHPVMDAQAKWLERYESSFEQGGVE
jgi:2-oxoisovalerate dehydrogenase E1 component alpha subunit